MAAFAHHALTNPTKDAARYQDYAFSYANALGVLWQKTTRGVATQAGASAGKGQYAAGSAFITENDEKVIEAQTPNTIGRLYEFMHELSHHYKGHIDKNLPYHVEEYEATKEAIDTMERDGFHLTPSVKKEAAWNIKQAIGRDKRKGVRIDPKAVAYVAELNQ